MLTVGTPQESPTSGTVLVQSRVVTTPGRHKVRVTVTVDNPTWVRLAHCASGGGVRTSVLLPVNTGMLGPVEIYAAYFALLDYIQIDMREGISADGTVQATVEVLPA